jgi:transcriptional regulator with XRE-family HTH domain
MSQAELAKAAQTSQQQIQRIEVGLQDVKLDLAARIADALGVDLPTLFPEVGAVLAQARSKRRLSKESKNSDWEGMRAWHEAGVGVHPYEWTVEVRMRGGAEGTYSIATADRDRLESVLTDSDRAPAFFAFPSSDRMVLLNLDHLILLHERFDVGIVEETADGGGEDEDVAGSVVVQLANSGERLYFDVEPEGEGDDVGPIRCLLGVAQLMERPGGFFDFVDINGETVYLRAADVALMEIPACVLDEGLLGEE